MRLNSVLCESGELHGLSPRWGPRLGPQNKKPHGLPMIVRWIGEGPIRSRGVGEKSQSRVRPFAKTVGSIIAKK
jgi:hypothetical protein